MESIWNLICENVGSEMASLVSTFVVHPREAILWTCDFKRTFKMGFLHQQAKFKSTKQCCKFMKRAFELNKEGIFSQYGLLFNWLFEYLVSLYAEFKLTYLSYPFDLVAQYGTLDLFKHLHLKSVNIEHVYPLKLRLSVNTLHLAILSGHLDIARYIIQHNMKTTDGRVARLVVKSLDMAIESDSIEMCEWVLCNLPGLGPIYKMHSDTRIKSYKMIKWLTSNLAKYANQKKMLLEHVDYEHAASIGDFSLLIKLEHDEFEKNYCGFMDAFLLGIYNYPWKFRHLKDTTFVAKSSSDFDTFETLLEQFRSELRHVYGKKTYVSLGQEIMVAAACGQLQLLKHIYSREEKADLEGEQHFFDYVVTLAIYAEARDVIEWIRTELAFDDERMLKQFNGISPVLLNKFAKMYPPECESNCEHLWNTLLNISSPHFYRILHLAIQHEHIGLIKRCQTNMGETFWQDELLLEIIQYSFKPRPTTTVVDFVFEHRQPMLERLIKKGIHYARFNNISKHMCDWIVSKFHLAKWDLGILGTHQGGRCIADRWVKWCARTFTSEFSQQLFMAVLGAEVKMNTVDGLNHVMKNMPLSTMQDKEKIWCHWWGPRTPIDERMCQHDETFKLVQWADKHFGLEARGRMLKELKDLTCYYSECTERKQVGCPVLAYLNERFGKELLSMEPPLLENLKRTLNCVYQRS